MNKRTAISLVGAAALLVLGVYASWVALYPEESDPKNIHYMLWKHGLSHNIDLDSAVAGMTHDTRAVNIVKRNVQMSRVQLDRRFGYVRTLDQVTPHLRECYTLRYAVGELGVPTHGKDVLFLRDSWQMVILDNGKAVDLVLCKGY